MAKFDKLKQQIQEFYGSRGNIPDHKTGIVTNLAKPKSIGLFFCIKTKKELDMIRALLRTIRNRKEEVTAYVFSPTFERIDVITDHSLVYFDLNDFTLTAGKKDQIKRIFEKDRPELLISFLGKPMRFCYKLASELNSDFKVGPNIEGYTGIYDLVLDIDSEKFNIIKFYEHVRHYLAVLNIKTR